MAISRQMLGINARNFLYVRRFNKASSVRAANNKLETKRRLIKHKVPTTKLVHVFENIREVRVFDWTTLPKSFVIKPAHGYGGEGIRIVRGWDGARGRVSKEGEVDVVANEALIFSILDGVYSLDTVSDTVIIEERVVSNPMFKKLGATGVSDIRIIVAHGIPVMAMLRMPTEYSDGKANLHLGAIGMGIDIRTGITTHGVYFGKNITHIPHTRVKVRGIKIPGWEEILTIAVRAQQASRLGYAGIDIVLDKIKGPLVLEVNARPGLSIQVANKDSLRTRLERVEDIHVATPEQGIEIAKNLFADTRLVAKIGNERTLHTVERITILGPKKRKVVLAKIDTGAYRTAIDSALLEELEIEKHDRVVSVRAGSHGKAQRRGTAYVRFKIGNKILKTLVAYNDRTHMRYPVIIGRRNLRGFLVDPTPTVPSTMAYTTPMARERTADEGDTEE